MKNSHSASKLAVSYENKGKEKMKNAGKGL